MGAGRASGAAAGGRPEPGAWSPVLRGTARPGPGAPLGRGAVSARGGGREGVVPRSSRARTAGADRVSACGPPAGPEVAPREVAEACSALTPLSAPTVSPQLDTSRTCHTGLRFCIWTRLEGNVAKPGLAWAQSWYPHLLAKSAEKEDITHCWKLFFPPIKNAFSSPSQPPF